ncbi:carboxymuconolactone decarboxylase family protein [Streptomyces sp. NPDC060209]|uniref:carboxymuconolactone decarboxylase family protein n=1 Tax=Streptomyces sp. NPDC060209 TaxID=3347073 RepID=UPI00365E44FE
MAKIPYPSSPQADKHLQDLPTPLNVFRMLNHAPSLTEPAVALGKALLAFTTLSPRLREMVILTVASRTRCPYESAQHAPVARAVGVTGDQIAALAENEIPEGVFAEEHRTALGAVTELLCSHTLNPRTVASLRDQYDDQEVVELIALTGYYGMLAGLVNSLDVDVDPAGDLLTPLVNRREPSPATSRNERRTS